MNTAVLSPGRCRWHTCDRGCAGRAGWPRVWRTSPGTQGRSAASPGSPWWPRRLLPGAWSQGQSSSPPATKETDDEEIFQLFAVESGIIQLCFTSSPFNIQFLQHLFSLSSLLCIYPAVHPAWSPCKDPPRPSVSVPQQPDCRLFLFLAQQFVLYLGYCLNCVPQPDHWWVRVG